MVNKRITLLIFLLITIAVGNALSLDRGITNTTSSSYAKLKSIDIGDVTWTDGFWADKFELCHKVMIPYMRMIYMDRAFKNFRIAAGLEEGEFWGKWWHDGDFYKWLEAAIYVYAITKDPELDRQIEEIIDVIGKAQEKDGYISTPIQIGHGFTVGRFTGEHRFTEKHRWTRAGDHEVYNLGHLMTAACIHYQVTGKSNFLDIARKAADHLYTIFKEPTPELSLLVFNPPHIMGLVELYRSTGEKKYLELANTFIDMRGMSTKGTDQNQNRVPFREVSEAVGHAVLATYLYAGVADVYAETGEKSLWDVSERLWENVTQKKMYITGGVGALHNGVSSSGDLVHEGFGREYQLPNATAYNETCANIGNGMWNWRLLKITGEARFADVMEKVFYNSGISGIGIYGTDFFYTNILRSYGKDHKLLNNDALKRWNLPRGGICCPPNVVRTIAEMSSYAYCVSDEGLWFNLYGSNKLETKLFDGSTIKLIQETDYPWDGHIKVTIQQCKKGKVSLMLRIPVWAQGATLKINGTPEEKVIRSGRYFEINRTWKKGDVLELTLPMEAQLMTANPLVEETRNQVAVQRGPVVYCLESKDLPSDVKVSEVMVPHNIKLQPHYDRSFLGGVAVLEGKANILSEGDWSKTLYQPLNFSELKEINLKLIPVYAWNNRGISSMTVWMPLHLKY